MPRKSKHTASRAVRAPEALQALGAWVEAADAGVKARGREYFEQGRVLAAWAEADHFIEADVQGGEQYRVTLFLTRGKWSSRCTCPVGQDCKHAVAAGLAWVGSGGVDFDFQDEPAAPPPEPPPDFLIPPPLHAEPAAAPPARKEKRKAFRDHWEPVLTARLGRPLTGAELRELGQLDALFAEFVRARHVLFDHMLRAHGFAAALPPDAQPWTPLFPGWWTLLTAPKDPWALWQYLAYSLEVQGRPIPELFRPLTDTAPIHAALDARFTEQLLHTWNTSLATSARIAAEASSTAALREATAGLRARLDAKGGLLVECRAAPDKPWKPPTQRWATALLLARPADFEAMPPAEGALALALALANRYGYSAHTLKNALPQESAAAVLSCRGAYPAIVLPDGRPFAIEAEPLVAEAVPSAAFRDRLDVVLRAPDGSDATTARLLVTKPVPLYLHAGRVWRGPPPLPRVALPVGALEQPQLMARIRAAGIRLPASLEARRELIPLRPRLQLALTEARGADGVQQLQARLTASADQPPCAQHWTGPAGWQWQEGSAPPARRKDDPILEFDLAAAQALTPRLAEFRLGWNEWDRAWCRPVTKNFPEEFLAWHASLPPGLAIETSAELAELFSAPLQATVDFTAEPSASGHDWFDLTVGLKVEDTTLTPSEIALLLKARGKWVRLPKGGWRRLELTGPGVDGATAATLDRLGLTAEDVLATGRATTHRLHALQLAAEAATLEARDARLATILRERVQAIAAQPPPPVPKELVATLRPYQQEGFQFLAHLAAQGFGGVLADDMGLGKTVQTLAWLLHAAAARGGKAAEFRALVVCPKSVTHGWLAEAARFAPTLRVGTFVPAQTLARTPVGVQLLVANYTQLRLNAEWFQQRAWDAVVLDEGQFIKNPSSQVAAAARALPARHRLVLTGTPVENRLTDLWSLFAFAQPGLLGVQTAFRRQYGDADPAAHERLHRRVRHFLLRRTKAQAAPDLPPRTEDDLVIELEGEQRRLYDAELKRARAQLLGIETARALDAVRFNVLASLLRLRQICCHPALINPEHRDLPSAKLEALLERLEELRDEGHQVLVFSQFVEMLEIIRGKLAAAGIGHLMLTGATENRAELVDEFQRDRTKTVFLLSLKAAGFGLNLTAASYAVLYDPWWNPAVEAQAIDRTHRIGQTRPVIAYRLLAANSIEQKIRALQHEKAALASAVVQEESLASVLDLESLRKILA